ncbi:MAG TPA: ABC transporter ATP-binding protein [Candidatus Hydrogenedens sp.]|nr:ABC transporter ATP-binding protein [Candidatus Hydrogenedens sp.]HPP58643.1 ABC transporter ATP-binding protein [Candidatus Hydrogenedens sp.]
MVRVEDCFLKLGPKTKFYCENFYAPPKSKIALWGPSGCGKSTLLNLISGLLKPERGKIVVNGIEITALSEAKLDHFRGENIGFIFQTFNLLPPFSAFQNVLLGMRFSDTIPESMWKEQAKKLLKRVGLGNRLYNKPSELSVGEQQRVAIARAVANKQKIIVADEPTGSLDPKTAHSVMQLLLELCEEQGVTLLLVTHDKSIADQLPQIYDCSNLVHEEENI